MLGKRDVSQNTHGMIQHPTNITLAYEKSSNSSKQT